MSAQTDAVILALMTTWQSLTGVQVADGPQVNSDPSGDWLFVGYNGDTPAEYNLGALADQSLMAFARTKAEDGQITCAIVSVSGDTDIPSTRARAYAVLSAAEDALRTNMQLGGLVMHAYVSNIQYFPVQAQPGAKVRLVFTVTYKTQL